MSRIPAHTVENAPEKSRPLLEKIAQASPTKRPLNVHAEMAHSAAVLAGYSSLRAVTADYGTLGPKVSWALNLATAGVVRNDYMLGIATRFAGMNGWDEAGITALKTGVATGDAKIDALVNVVRAAAANSGKVNDPTWKAALEAGWSSEEITEAFAYLGLTLFTGYFLNFAQTSKDA